jgi:hypothetical protein
MNISRVILIAIVVIVAILATLFLAKIVEAVSNATSPVERVPATLAKKRERGTGDDTSYVLIFDLDDDETMTLTVPESVYRSVSEGVRGTLEHKGTRFIGFDPK